MIRDIACSASRDDYDVQTILEHVLMQSVAFPDQPGQMMSYNAVSYFFAHRNTQPIFFRLIGEHIHHEIPVCIGFSATIHPLKISRLFQ